MNIADIVKLIPALSYEDLKQIDNHVKIYIKYKSPKKDTTNVELTYQAISLELEKTLGPILCYHAFVKTLNFVKLKDVTNYFDNIIEKIISPHLTVTKFVRYKFYTISILAILEYLDNLYIPYSLDSIFRNYKFLLPTLKRKFPGYIESNLFHLMLFSPTEVQAYLKTQ